jgi:hypothetical protein
MPSKEWNKYTPEEIRNCLLGLSFNFLNYCGSAFSKKESKAVSDIVLYYAGMTDKWLEIAGHSNNVFNRKIVNKQPIGNININLSGSGIRVFMEAILPALSGGNIVTVSNFSLDRKKTAAFYDLLNKSHIPGGSINISGELDILSLKGSSPEIPGNIEKYTITKEILY